VIAPTIRAAEAAPVLFLHADAEEWLQAAVADIAGALQRALLAREGHERTRLLLSGGSTPAPVYRALARAPLDWQRIELGLVDERWLPEHDPASNARLVRETLLREGAAGARFEPMLMPPHSIEDSVRAANAAARAGAVAVLGMGEDGHTASLFPHTPGLAAALAASEDFVAVDAGTAPVAQPWPRRISLTPAGLARASARILLLRGERKRGVLLRALDGDDAMAMPVRAAFALPGAPLRVHWCP
jgi:6-phosphogluconolactonase